MAEDLRFAKTHEWAKISGEEAIIGISDYAQAELGDVVFVELPEIGKQLKQGEQFGTIESTKAASELYSPLSGKVTAVNEELTNSPQLVNEDPLGKGWMVQIKISSPQEAGGLLTEQEYKEYLEKEH